MKRNWVCLLAAIGIAALTIATRIIPPDPAPEGCYTQETHDWTIDDNQPAMWGMAHWDGKTNLLPNCGMSIQYRLNGQVFTFEYLYEGKSCDLNGACIENIGGNSYGSAPPGVRVDRASVFNGVPEQAQPTATSTAIVIPPSPTQTPVFPTPTPPNHGCTGLNFCISLPVIWNADF